VPPMAGERGLALVGASVLALLVPAVLAGHTHVGPQDHLHGDLALQGAAATSHPAGHGSAAGTTHSAHAVGGAVDSSAPAAHVPGYLPHPPVPAGWCQHYLNYGNLDDGHILDPQRPEALFYAMTDEGYRPISALYILPHAGMPAPDVGGCLTHWHTHPEIFL